jgi:hypothetical protein
MKYKLIGYYKYVFSFMGSDESVVCLGGYDSYIYRMNINPTREYTLQELKDMGGIL